MLVNVLSEKESYTPKQVADLLGDQSGWIVVTHANPDTDNKAYAAVVAGDGSVTWWVYKDDTLVPWEDTEDEETLIFPYIPDTLKAQPKAPQTVSFDALFPESYTTWLLEDWRIPEILVHYVIQYEKDFDWDSTTAQDIKEKLISVAAFLIRKPFQLTIHGSSKGGRHISQDRQDANMQKMLANIDTGVNWAGQNEYYEGVPYAEYYYQDMDFHDPRCTLFVALSKDIMGEYDCDLEGWHRDYNDGAYDAASGYSAYQSNAVLDVENSHHQLMEYIKQGKHLLETLNTESAQRALSEFS